MNAFEAVKANVTAYDVAVKIGLKPNRAKMICCPFHGDKHPSMKVDKRYYCFGCGENGDAVDFVSKYFAIGLKDSAVKICECFHLSYDDKPYFPRQETEYKKTLLIKFEESEKYMFRVLSDYLHLLKRWKTEYAPKDETEEWHPYFCEALKETDYVEYLLDTFLTVDVPDRAFLIADYGRRTIEIERRLKELGSGDKEENFGSGRTARKRKVCV